MAQRRGNPNFRKVWTVSADKVIRVPEYLADTLIALARAVDSGKISKAELDRMVIDRDAIADQVSKII